MSTRVFNLSEGSWNLGDRSPYLNISLKLILILWCQSKHRNFFLFWIQEEDEDHIKVSCLLLFLQEKLNRTYHYFALRIFKDPKLNKQELELHQDLLWCFLTLFSKRIMQIFWNRHWNRATALNNLTLRFLTAEHQEFKHHRHIKSENSINRPKERL